MSTSVLHQAVERSARRFGLTDLALPPADWIDLAGADLYEATPDSIRSATGAAVDAHQADHYTRRPGVAALCARVAERLGELGIATKLEHVIITGGIAEARFLAIRAYGEGRAILLPPSAALEDYPVLAQLSGATVQQCTLDNLPAVPNALLVLPDPDPATGRCLTAAQVARISAWAVAQQALIVADMSLVGLLREPHTSTPIAADSAVAGQVIMIGGFNDLPGLDAWQVAWCAGPGALLGPALELKQAMTICSPAVSQYAALAGGAAERAAVRAARAERVAAVTALLDRIGVPYADPATLAYVVADVAAFGGGAAVAQRCAAHGVGVAWGAALGDPAHIRITAIAAGLTKGLARLEAALSEGATQS
jgi:aspartate/methionine/tyrosine aminotransferase